MSEKIKKCGNCENVLLSFCGRSFCTEDGEYVNGGSICHLKEQLKRGKKNDI